MNKNNLYWAGVIGLFALVFFYASYKLTESPPTWYDEGLYIQVAHSIAERGTQSVQTAPGEFISTGFVTGGYPFLAPVALSLRIFGDNLFAARLPMIVFILALAVAVFLFMYRLFGRQDALLALLLLATFPLLYGNGKNVLGEVPGLFYITLALLFLWRLELQEFKGIYNYLFLGIFTGLAAVTKPIFFFFFLAIGLVLLLCIRSIPLRC